MCKRLCSAKCRETFSALWREIPGLLTRRFKSTYHARSWKDYEKLLFIRTQLATFSRILFTSLVIFSGGSQTTTDYLDQKGGPANAELARDVLPYAALGTQVCLIARIVLWVASFKWWQLIKYHLYLEFLL